MDLAVVARTLFDPQKVGVLTIPKYIDDALRSGVLEEVNLLSYAVMPSRYGNAVQDFEMAKARLDLPAAAQVYARLSSLAQGIGVHAGFSQVVFNEVTVNRYARGARGITAHRDEYRFRNLVAIVLLAGHAPFLVGRSAQELEELNVSPGDVILLRAPRCPAEKSHRPVHAVGQAVSERITLIARYDAKSHWTTSKANMINEKTADEFHALRSTYERETQK